MQRGRHARDDAGAGYSAVKPPILVVAAVAGEVRRISHYQTSADATYQSLRERSRTDLVWPVCNVIPGICDVVVSGIGRANAAGATVFAMARCAVPYATVINVGVAGALPRGEATLGDVIVGDAAVFVEEGISLPDGSSGDMSALGFDLLPKPYSDGNLIRPHELLCDELAHLASSDRSTLRGSIATVARCSGTDASADAVVRRTAAIAEAMEGAAVLLASHRMGCHNCAELRVISNNCGDRNLQRWDLSAALSRLESVLDALIAAVRL